MPPSAPALPDLRLVVDGVDVRRQLSDDVIAITVQEDLGAITMFTIELYNWDQHRQRVTWSDRNTFLPGAEAKISLGYVDDVVEVMTGEVVSLEPSFVEGEPPRLVVRGFDFGWRLDRARRTRSFLQLADSDIARRVIGDSGLSGRITTTNAVHDYVVQSNQTDWEFLSERAARIGHVLRARGRTIHFEPLGLGRGAAPEDFDLAEDVWAFHPRLSGRLEADNVAVRGWDPKRKQVIEARTSAGALRIGQGRPGTQTVRAAFGPAGSVLATTPVASRSEADAMAQAWFERLSLTYVTGELVGQGRPTVHVGQDVNVTGAGSRFSGRYLVTGVNHTMEMAGGYRTRLFVRRNLA